MESISQHSELTKVVDVLKQPSKSRNQREIDIVVLYLSNCLYFQRKSKEFSQDFLHMCARAMTYEHISAGQVIYAEGDCEGKLYLLLSGSVVTTARATPLLPKETFGEEVLGEKCQETLTTLDHSELAVLHKTDYFDIVSKLTEKSHMELINFLHSLPTFARISRGALQRIIAAFEIRVLVWKQVLCRAGDPADEVYIVKQGEFTLFQAISARKSVSPIESIASFRAGKNMKQRTSVALVGPGEFIAEEDAIRGQQMSQTCVCHSLEGQVLVLQAQVHAI
jgi:CRP-like cAMP-binding protein